ncbi:MAG: hypothetical protein FJ253_02855, partial [Phycisphaerae bacterium]|nr:hypothetical protein [Phycisphaerae bacterium]
MGRASAAADESVVPEGKRRTPEGGIIVPPVFPPNGARYAPVAVEATGAVPSMSSPSPTNHADSFGEFDAGRVTELLRAAAGGESAAIDEIFPVVYACLRTEAGRLLRTERSGHTLQPTALVHEAWLRLSANGGVRIEDRLHFRAVAALVMRRILVDHARRRGRLKRGGGGDAPRLETIVALEPLDRRSA